MHDYKEHIKSINKDYTSTYFAEYMQDEYGVQVGYTPVPRAIIGMKKTLADWQLKSDCCVLCETSKLPGKGIIVSYARLPETPDYCSPFQPLFPGGMQKACRYKGKGDFNKSFNSDFFK